MNILDKQIFLSFTREEIEYILETMGDGMLRAEEFSPLGREIFNDPAYVMIKKKLEKALVEEAT